MKSLRELTHPKLLVLLILFLVLAPMSVSGQNHFESLELQDLLPQYNNYTWSYLGSVEYGHDMKVDRIIASQMSTHYIINGAVHDMSDGEADTDFSIQLEYIVESDVIIQTKTEEAMLDSEYDEIELIRTPLEKGTTWTQEVQDSNGDITTLKSIITDIEDTDNGLILTVRYDDTNSDYYEEREIQEGVGVVSFVKSMSSEGDSYPMGYSLHEEASGLVLDSNFRDITGNEWYRDYVAKLVTLNLISGYPDQTFRPKGEITVAEFITVTVEALSHYPEAVSAKWYEPYVSMAIELEMIEENEFEDYNRPISREEMAKIIINAIDEEPQSGQLDFSDAAEIGDEFAPYIYTAVELGIIEGYPSDNSFGPKQTTTRAEASTIFALLVEKMIDIEVFGEDDALALEDEFESRLYQETQGSSWVVEDFDEVENLIDYIAEIADRELVKTYVDNYYKYIDGELSLPPKDGITQLIVDRDYQLEMIHPRAYSLIQETSTEMIGHYTLTITYHYENDRWIMKDRHVEVHEDN